MKIVHLCLANFFIDNYSYQENLLTKYHVRMGYEVTVIASLFTFGKDGKGCLLDSPCEYVNADGVKVIRLDYKKDLLKKFNRRLRRYDGFKNALTKEAPDIIFVHNTSFVDAAYVVKYKQKHPNVRIFADSHADWINSARNWVSLNIQHKILWRYTTRQLTKVAEKIFGVLPIRCEFLQQVYKVPCEKIEYLPLGVDDEAILNDTKMTRKQVRSHLGLQEYDFVVATGGKIDALKNTTLLMQAINEINNPKVHLIVFGTVFPELKEQFQGLLSDKIHYVGWANAQEVINYLLASDVACFPGTHSTLWEESIGLGLPCIFKHWKGMEHVNKNGNCVFLYQDSVQEIKNLLQRFFVGNFYDEILIKAKEAAPSFRYSEIAKKAIGIDCGIDVTD